MASAKWPRTAVLIRFRYPAQLADARARACDFDAVGFAPRFALAARAADCFFSGGMIGPVEEGRNVSRTVANAMGNRGWEPARRRRADHPIVAGKW